MTRTGVEPSRWDAQWTGEELAESYAELGELEPHLEGGPELEATPEGEDLELVATLEAREGVEVRALTLAAPTPATAREQQEAETYAVLPELELLVGLAEYGRVDAARDEASEESAPELVGG